MRLEMRSELLDKSTEKIDEKLAELSQIRAGQVSLLCHLT